MIPLLALVLLLVYLLTLEARPKVLLLVDPFTSYLSGHCKSWCEGNGVRVVEAVSEYCCNTLAAEGRIVPDALKAPLEGDEYEWSVARSIVADPVTDPSSSKGWGEGIDDAEEDEEGDSSSEEDEEVPDIDDVYVISESEAGIPTAERIQIAIGAPGNGCCPQLCDKYVFCSMFFLSFLVCDVCLSLSLSISLS
jgi:hypothetical protein